MLQIAVSDKAVTVRYQSRYLSEPNASPQNPSAIKSQECAFLGNLTGLRRSRLRSGLPVPIPGSMSALAMMRHSGVMP